MLRRNAQLFPLQEACIDHAAKTTSTWGEVRARVAKLASGLQSIGLENQGRVAILSLNSTAYLEAMYAVPWAGGIIVPLNTRLAVPEIAAILEDSQTKILMLDPSFIGYVDQLQVEGVQFVVMQGRSEAPNVLTMESLIEKGSVDCLDAMRSGDDTYGLFYTSGTTGKAKGVQLTHGNHLVNALGHLAPLQYTNLTRYLHSAPMFHLADFQMSIAVTLAGGVHVFIAKFTPPDTLNAIQTYKINKALMVSGV